VARRTARQQELVDKFSVNDAPHRIGLALREVRRGATAPKDTFPPGIEWGQQYDALGVLVITFPDGCRMSELARALRVDASTTTRAVDRLVASGLAERTRSEDDGRALIVETTRKGIATYLAAAEVTSPAMRSLLNAALSPAEQEVLADLLERIIKAYDDADVEE
jgi:DNA-binding MarR family transcriptional regulator